MNERFEPRLFARPSLKLVRQSELAESGLACLAMVAAYHGLQIDIGVLRRRFVPSSRGVSLGSLMTTADRLGLTPRIVRVDSDDLGALALPAILHLDMNHYVVLEAISGRKALVHDPEGSSRWMGVSELVERYKGEALELHPSASFETGEIRHRLRLRQLWTGVRGLKRALVQTVLLSFILQLLALVTPYYLQLVVDSALPQQNLEFLAVLALGFGLVVLLGGIASLLRSWVLLSIGASFSYGLSANLARKLFRLPVDWFGRRHLGDILFRFRSVAPIRNLLTQEAPAALVDGVLALLTLLLMFIYSPLLSVVSLSALTFYGILRVSLFRRQRAAQEESIVVSGLEHSILIESLRGVRALRLSGQEPFRRALWQSRMGASVNADARHQQLTNFHTIANTTLFGLENVVVVWLAITLVMGGGFSIGMVFAYLAYKTQFLTAGTSLIDKATAFKLLGLSLERVSDIALAEEDVSFASTPTADLPLNGRLELRGVHYRYGADDPFVLRGVDLTVKPGESVAITGPSGGGKSTLVQIILGLVEPSSGEVLVDGVALRSFGYQNYHRQIAAVLQDDTLFAGAIAENIAMFDEHIDLGRVRSAARAAAIADDIEAMPMAYETLVGDMGAALSGGQRQRLLLARALYRQPKILVIDEGTSHLDEAREREVNRAISGLGITRIIIAHRAATLASADRVLMLKAGTLSPQDPPGEPAADQLRDTAEMWAGGASR